MDDEYFIKKAIEEAEKSVKAGGLPLGALVVRNDSIIASGTSHVGDLDPTAHFESDAIRQACQKLHTLDLSECTLYTTLEPCSMCLACASWCGVKRVVFGAYKENIPKNPYEISNYHAEEHGKRMTSDMEVRGGICKDACAKLMEHMVNWTIQNE